MRKYAVLGGTGSTGSELCKLLTQRADVHLNVYARSASKLAAMVPELAEAKNTTSYIGSLSDCEQFASCLDGASVIFSTVAQNANEPGCSVARTTAQAIVHALEILRSRVSQQGLKWAPPKLVLLTSTSLNPAAAANEPALLRKLVYFASWYVYEDIRLSIQYLESEAPWLPLVFAAPGGLVQDKSYGIELMTEISSPTVSYADLAKAMVDMGEQDDWEGKYVGVRSLGDPRFDLLLKNVVLFLLPGALVSCLPWTFGWLKRIGCF